MKLSAQIFSALIIGVFYYMVAVMLTVYEGILSLIFQPIAGAVLTTVAIVVCLIVGLPIRLSKRIKEFWEKYWWNSFVFGTIGFVFMALSNTNSFKVKVYDSFLEEEVLSLNPTLAICGWVVTIFAVLHFFPPIRNKEEKTSQSSRQDHH